MGQFKADVSAAADLETSESLVQTIVDAVADAEGVDAFSLPPLYTAVDPDALEALLTSGNRFGDPGPVEVTFSYYGYRITVDGDGGVTLSE